jgi:hypothetical protein
MIRLTRGARPPVLDLNADQWRDEYLRLRAGDTSVPAAAAIRYRHPEIKEAVLRDSRGKCAYCESRPRAVSPGDVEHVEPKARAPERVVDWTNLTFACSWCNSYKGEYWSDDTPLLDPYHDEPRQHLFFIGPMVRFSSPRGELTRSLLRLNRASLLESRNERLEAIESLIQRYKAMPDGPDRGALEQVIREEARDDQEYSAAVSDFLQLHDFDVA